MLVNNLQGQSRFFTGKTWNEDWYSIMGELKVSNILRKQHLYGLAGQHFALAYLNWTGFEIDYENLPKTFVTNYDETTPLNEKATEIIAGLIEGMYNIDTMAVVDKQCFPAMESWVSSIES